MIIKLFSTESPSFRGFGRAPRGTAVPLSSESVRGLGRLRNAPAAFGYFPPVESNEGTVLSSRTTVRLLRDLDNTNFPDCGTKRCALEPRYFPAMESTQRYGRRGVSNPPSCTSISAQEPPAAVGLETHLRVQPNDPSFAGEAGCSVQFGMRSAGEGLQGVSLVPPY